MKSLPISSLARQRLASRPQTTGYRRFDAYKDDPIAFAREVLGVKLWSRQEEILRAALVEGRVAVRSGHKVGKLCAPSTPIPTPEGIRRFGDLKVGDKVFSETGEPCTIVGEVHWKDRPMMRVNFEDGTFVDVDERHEWLVHSRESRKRTYKPAVIKETRELFEKVTVPNGKGPDGMLRQVSNWTVDLPKPLELPTRELPIDPWVFGYLLGNGSSDRGGTVTCHHDDREWLIAQFARCGERATRHAHPQSFGVLDMGLRWRELCPDERKRIPHEYLWASKEQRLALLQGLMDSDGHCTAKGLCEFTNTNENIVHGVLHLVRSLGMKARLHEKPATIDGRYVSQCWRVIWCAPTPVFRLPRKLERLKQDEDKQHKVNAWRRMAIISIEELPQRQDSKCIEVDSPSHLFLCGDSYVPTHNSAAAICIALWYASTRPSARVILTAPTHRQIRAILWRELKQLYHNALKPLGGELHELPEIGLQWEDGREIVGFYTTEPEKMAGISGAHVLFVVDEASGIPNEIYEAIEGNRAGGAKLVMFSNPTQTSGTFFEAFHRYRAYWKCIAVSSEEAAEQGIPGLATKDYIHEKRMEWGEASPLYQVRIAGNFPNQQSDAVIALVDAEASKERWADTNDDAPLQIGVDPARFGDDRSIIFPRRGLKAFEAIKVIGQDTHQVGARALELARRLRFSVHERPIIKVDVIGLGAGVCDYLREYAKTKEIGLVEVSAAAPAKDEKRYHNLRSELWFRCAEWLKRGGAIPDDDELLSELTTPTYDFDLKNRLRVMSKDDIKAAIGRSPDKADALCLAVYDAPIARFGASIVRSRFAE